MEAPDHSHYAYPLGPGVCAELEIRTSIYGGFLQLQCIIEDRPKDQQTLSLLQIILGSILIFCAEGR